jgi:cell division protein FtsB
MSSKNWINNDMSMQPSYQSNIFETSLTELAFIFFFILALFAAWRIGELNDENVSEKQSNESLEKETEALSTEVDALKADIAAYDEFLANNVVTDPEELFRSLRLAEESKDQIQQLEQQLEESHAQASALQEALEPYSNPDEIRQIVEDHIELTEQLVISEDQSLPREVQQLAQELNDFRGQNIYLRNQLAKSDGGYGPPPCWLDPLSGKTQTVFDAVMNESAIILHAGWPTSRETEALANSNIMNAIGTYENVEEFINSTRPLFEYSVTNECRHVIAVYDETETKDAYKPMLETIERHFYKDQVNRKYEPGP